MKPLSDFERGMIAGILVGQGHFGGDGRQPQLTLKMNVRHERLLHWIHERLPGSKLYGPYEHDARRYFQLMARGDSLRSVLDALGDALEIDPHVADRVEKMRSLYDVR
ncbi:MAG: hypothetical protein ACRDNS_33890 [Trebonia sp.]